MKKLFLLRHAKSSWEDANLSDFDRPLNDRGERDAPFMGGLMKERDLAPEVIVSSPANRARTTAELVREAGDLEGDLRFDESIYEASPGSLSEVASKLDDKFSSAMLVGHNPGMERAIQFLTGRLASMPTAALAVIDLDIGNWSEISEGCGRLVEIIRPKEARAEREVP